MVPGVVVASPARAHASWFERRSCRCKVTHASRREARAAARHMIRRHGGRLEPYHCGFCDGWHVGHPTARR